MQLTTDKAISERVLLSLPQTGAALRALFVEAGQVSDSPQDLLLQLFHAAAFSMQWDPGTQDYTTDVMLTREGAERLIEDEVDVEDVGDEGFDEAGALRRLGSMMFDVVQAFAADTASSDRPQGLRLYFVTEEYTEERMYSFEAYQAIPEAVALLN